MRALGAGVLALLLAPAGAAQEVATAPSALLRGLDKVAGATTDFELAQGDEVRFGRLSIRMGECRYPVDDPSSNAYGWVTIRDDNSPTPVFEGWMIAQAPALNALDDPRYDVWLIRCKSASG